MSFDDAVVVGACVNGMVARVELAGAGSSVALIDERDWLGRFDASDELTLPGFVHDTFSSWHPLFVTEGAYAELGADLHRRGLVYRSTPTAVTASVSEQETTAAYRDPDITAAGLAHGGDAAYTSMLSELEGRTAHVFGALGSKLCGRDLVGPEPERCGAAAATPSGPGSRSRADAARCASGGLIYRDGVHDARRRAPGRQRRIRPVRQRLGGALTSVTLAKHHRR